MKRIGGLLLVLVACAAVASTFIRSDVTAGATSHQPRDQTPVCKPALPLQREPVILRPNSKGPFRLPVFVVPGREQKDRTARQPGGSASE